MVAADWLQGPYVYALYEEYGWEREVIALLFVLGFGSSMILGTFCGSLADSVGRKKSVLLYVVLYSLSCVTKHNRSFGWLASGRLFGGAATSLLMSVFESWVVCEYHKLDAKQLKQVGSSEVGAPSDDGRYSLSNTFSYSTLLNFVVAIVAGIVAESAVDRFPFSPDPRTSESSTVWFVGGFTAPFDVAVGMLLIGGFLCYTLWSENYGTKGSQEGKAAKETMTEGSLNTLMAASRLILGNFLILCVGLSQAFFEGSMYSFVFMWTPALKAFEESIAAHSGQPVMAIPYGSVFSTFMLCSMLGSQVFSLLLNNKLMDVHHILQVTFLLAFVALSFGPLTELLEMFNIRFSVNLQYVGFLLFEVCVGMYFPSMGSLKSKIVPEENRTTIYNLFRIPLNLIVLVVLLSKLSVNTTFLACSFLLMTCTAFQFIVNSNLLNR